MYFLACSPDFVKHTSLASGILAVWFFSERFLWACEPMADIIWKLWSLDECMNQGTNGMNEWTKGWTDKLMNEDERMVCSFNFSLWQRKKTAATQQRCPIPMESMHGVLTYILTYTQTKQFCLIATTKLFPVLGSRMNNLPAACSSNESFWFSYTDQLSANNWFKKHQLTFGQENIHHL